MTEGKPEVQTYQVTRKRGMFGQQIFLEDRGPEMVDSLAPDPAQYRHYVLRNPVHCEIQNTTFMAEHEVNTVRAQHTSSGVTHVEGGWPKDVNMQDPEATQRYRRKIEKDDSYIHCVMHLSHTMEHYILQNNALDLYEWYYAGAAGGGGVERGECRAVGVLREGNARRALAALSWQADGGQRLAAAHHALPGRGQHFANVWDIENPNAPELTLKPPHPLYDLQYNPREQHTLVGGLLSGQVVAFDTRRGPEVVASCPPSQAHRDPARSVLYINSKTCAEFFSSSTDGQCKWWDTRNLSQPTDVMIIDPVASVTDEQDINNALGVSVLEYESTIPTRFMCGTENGLIIGGNRKGKSAMEKLPARYNAHLGPVYSLQRNPAFLKNFLTVGDWSARVWSEDCKDSAILWTYYHSTKLTDGAWNPVRFSLFMVSQWDGCVSCWDLLRRQGAPVVTVQLCDEPLTKIKPHEGGRLVACGSQKGSIYLAELSENLGTADKNDKMLLTHIFDRENKRERILEARMREMRLKMKQGRATEVPPDGGANDPNDKTAGDKDLTEATEEYMLIIEKEKAALNQALAV